MVALAYILLLLGTFLAAISLAVLVVDLVFLKEGISYQALFSIIFFIITVLMMLLADSLIRRYDLDYINDVIVACQKNIAETSKKLSNYEEGTNEYEMIYVKYLKLNNKLSLYQSRFDNRIKQLKSDIKFKEEK